jgi:hypothetical protein
MRHGGLVFVESNNWHNIAMVSALPYDRPQEEYRIPTEGSDVLYVRMLHPRRPSRPKRLVFITPLIGGTSTQPLILLRDLARRGSILMSFEYRGHPRSTGVFDLERTIVDARYALLWAADYAAQHAIPLHGFAFCYGAYTLAAQFAPGGPGRYLRSFSTISGLFRLDQMVRFEDFVPVYSRRLGKELTVAAFLGLVEGRAFDSGSVAFRAALHEYLAAMFPQLKVGQDYFEELQYGRVDIPNSLRQLTRANCLTALDVPREIPCNFFFGYSDSFFSLSTPEGRDAYSNHIRSLIPHAQVCGADIDHFGFGPEHDPLVEKVGDLFEQHDGCPVYTCAKIADNSIVIQQQFSSLTAECGQKQTPLSLPVVQEMQDTAAFAEQPRQFLSEGNLIPGSGS